MKWYFLHSVLFFITFCTNAQRAILNSQVSTYASAGQGDLFVDDEGVYYIGLQNGSLKELGVIVQKGTLDGQILKWDTTAQNWLVADASSGDLSTVKDTIHYQKRANLKFQAFNNLSGLNSLTPEFFFYNETSATISGNNVTNLEGDLRFILELNFTTAAERTNFNVNFNVNNATANTVYGSAYGRVLDNHNETSARYVFEYEGAQTTDVFGFDIVQEAFTSASASLASSILIRSQLFVHQYDTTVVLSDLKSPPELILAQGPQGIAGLQGPQGTTGPVIGSPSDVYHSAGRVLSSGFATYSYQASVTRNSTGRYSVSFSTPHPNGADYAVIFAMEQNAGDNDYKPSYNNVTANGFDIEIGSQDNGTSGGVPVDAGFSFYVAL